MKRAKVISELRKANILKAECPECGQEFAVSKATLFDASGTIPEEVRVHIASTEADFRDRAEQVKHGLTKLKQRKLSATVVSERCSVSVGMGFILEKLALGWREFPHKPHDCRPLFEPIDYVAFDGVTEQDEIRTIAFIDMKTGEAKLNKHQRLIKDAIENGNVDYREI